MYKDNDYDEYGVYKGDRSEWGFFHYIIVIVAIVIIIFG